MKFVRVITIIAITILLVACGSSPQSALNDFYRSTEAGDITKAYSLCSSNMHQMLGEQKLKLALGSIHDQIKAKGGIKDIKIKGEPDKEIANLELTITYGSGRIETGKENLVLENGQWKIDSKM